MTSLTNGIAETQLAILDNLIGKSEDVNEAAQSLLVKKSLIDVYELLQIQRENYHHMRDVIESFIA